MLRLAGKVALITGASRGIGRAVAMAFAAKEHGSPSWAAVSPAPRADPEAVTPAFVFFASSDSDYITGQVLAVDGGLTA